MTPIRYERASALHDMYVAAPSLAEAAPEMSTSRSFSFAPLLFLLLAPLSLSLAGVGATTLFLSDTETSTGNTFAAGPLDFTLSAEGLLEGDVGDGEASGFSVTPEITPASNMLPFSYEVSAVLGGDEAFCAALQVTGSAPPLSYSGDASSFFAGPTNDLTPWELSFFVPLGTSINEGATCMVDITYAGYQEGSSLGVMYHDSETLSLLLTYAPTPPVVPALLEIQSFGAPEVLGEEIPSEEPPVELPPETPEEGIPEEGTEGVEGEGTEEMLQETTEEQEEPAQEEIIQEEEETEEPPAEIEETTTEELQEPEETLEA